MVFLGIIGVLVLAIIAGGALLSIAGDPSDDAFPH